MALSEVAEPVVVQFGRLKIDNPTDPRHRVICTPPHYAASVIRSLELEDHEAAILFDLLLPSMPKNNAAKR